MMDLLERIALTIRSRINALSLASPKTPVDTIAVRMAVEAAIAAVDPKPDVPDS